MSKKAMDFLTARNISFRYFKEENPPVLEHAELRIEKGTITVITGSSGCGKSTLAAVCTGLYPENAGELIEGTVALCQQDLKYMSPAQKSRLLAMMFQNPDLQFCMNTLRKELIFCLENISVPREVMDAKVTAFAKELGIGALLDRDLQSLSGGEKQKAALCCLLLLEPEGLLLDEPFANIDDRSIEEMIDLLKKLHRRRKMTIIVIDHKLEHWLGCADEIKIIGKGGKIIKQNITPANLVQYQELFGKEGIAFPGKRGRCSRQAKKQENSKKSAVLQLQQVSIDTEDKKCLLENIDIQVPKGEIHAVIGPSGSGKTTCFLTLLKQHPYQGTILLHGSNLKEMKHQEVYKQIGIVFQNPSRQFVTTRVLDEVLFSLKIRNQKATPEALEKQAGALLKSYQLQAYENYSPYMLSQGQQRRLAVLSMLAGGQSVLLLDEPTYGQDARSTRSIMEHLLEKAATEALTVLFSTHDQELAKEYADQMYYVTERTLMRWNG